MNNENDTSTGCMGVLVGVVMSVVLLAIFISSINRISELEQKCVLKTELSKNWPIVRKHIFPYYFNEN